MSRINRPVGKQILSAALTLLMLTGLVSCSDDISSFVPTECRVVIEVTGVAGTVDVAYYDQADDPIVELFSETGAAVPYTHTETESIDYTDIQNRQVDVTADVAVDETMSLTVYYDEVYEYSPYTIRTTIVEESYLNSEGATETGYTMTASFALPLQ